MVFGLDMRFLGRKWQKKSNGDRNDNRMSCFVFSGSAPAQKNDVFVDWAGKLVECLRSHPSQSARWMGYPCVFSAGGEEQAEARARCWLGDGGGREADFSAAPLTENVIGFSRNDSSSFGWRRTDNSPGNGKGYVAGGRPTLPPIASA